ncbi:MAG: alpha/beta hydrolase [Clostridia bacterium]|nr:alpha/beta hydrolase [Clostridia bacterium]
MNIIEERVFIDGEYKIGATISRPDDIKRPLVLLIMGTGKLDRDGNMKGYKTDLYKNMSDMFVNMGYVCIRYDKRGTHESGGKFKIAGLSDLVNDSASVVEYARTLPYIDENRIIACGHSEGAMIATLLTKQTKLERIILLGGACMCLKSAMEYQNFKMLD